MHRTTAVIPITGLILLFVASCATTTPSTSVAARDAESPTLSMTGAANAAQPKAAIGTAYRGVSKCLGMTVTVTFAYDRAASRINEFSSENACAAGGTHSLWKVEEPISVKADGSFFHADKGGNWVNGRITPDGRASGTFSPSPFTLMCKDGSFQECTNWAASPAR